VLLTIVSNSFCPFCKIKSFGIFIHVPSSLSPAKPSPRVSIYPFRNSFVFFCSSVELVSAVRRLFFVSFISSKCFHKYERFNDASTIWDLLPLGMTGYVCLKSPPITTFMPPNGLSWLLSFVNLWMSLKLLSSALKQCLLVIGASSHNIRDILLKSSARNVPCLKSQVDSLLMFSGMWNRECAVLPPGTSSAAIPLDATAKTIFPSARSDVLIAFQRNVFPVPPYPLTNISLPSYCLLSVWLCQKPSFDQDSIFLHSFFEEYLCHSWALHLATYLLDPAWQCCLVVAFLRSPLVIFNKDHIKTDLFATTEQDCIRYSSDLCFDFA
jgi:hypothetical protein